MQYISRSLSDQKSQLKALHSSAIFKWESQCSLVELVLILHNKNYIITIFFETIWKKSNDVLFDAKFYMPLGFLIQSVNHKKNSKIYYAEFYTELSHKNNFCLFCSDCV